jgi:hypothetical protein
MEEEEANTIIVESRDQNGTRKNDLPFLLPKSVRTLGKPLIKLRASDEDLV